MKIRLHAEIRVPNERAREFDLEFTGPEVLIGRDRESDIQIPLSAVSRKHAKIFEKAGEWFVEDLASTHGTKVNGQMIGVEGKKLLREGDLIEIVHAAITFHLLDDAKVEEASDEKTSVVAQKMVRELLDRPDQNADLPYLLVMNGPKEGLKVSLNPDIQEFTIGRTESADLRIDDANVSRRHAFIKREWNEFLIQDLESKNGVILNGRKISSPTRLKDADEIYLGAVHLTFIDPTASVIGRLEEIAAFAAEPPAPGDAIPEEVSEISQPPIAPAPGPISPVSPLSVSLPTKEFSLTSGIGGMEILMVILVVTVLAGLIYGVLLLWTP